MLFLLESSLIGPLTVSLQAFGKKWRDVLNCLSAIFVLLSLCEEKGMEMIKVYDI